MTLLLSLKAIIFVIDAADDLRFGVARNELELLLEHEGKLQNKRTCAITVVDRG